MRKYHKVSDETKQKMSIAHSGNKNTMFGKIHSAETRLKISNALIGRKLSENHKRKIGKASKGRICSPETRKKRSELMKGNKLSPEIRKKISESLKGRPTHIWLKESRKKVSEFHKGKPRPYMRGELHPNWQGGKTAENLLIREQIEYKLWREAVFDRDDFTCQTCGKKECYLEAHHIKSFSKYPELILAIDNGITLCKDCHKLTDNYKGKGQSRGGQKRISK